MGSFCSPTPATVNQTQTYRPSPQITAAGTQALQGAESAASQPFQMPQAPVAGFNPFQQQAFGQIQGMQGDLDPFVQNASGSMTSAGTALTAEDIQQYMNPYSDQALADMKKYIFDPQRRDTMGKGVQSAGGVGAERLALTSQNLDKTQADALGQARAGFYQNAAQIAQNQKNMALQSAQGWLGLGLGAQSGNLQATNALGAAGAQQQGQEQRELMSPYQQTLARIAYPFQTSQFLAGIAGGLAPAFGGTTTGYGTSTPSQPSPFAQMLGGAGVAVGAAGALGYGPSSGGGTNATMGDMANLYGGTNNGPISSPFAEGGEVEGSGNPWDGIIPHMNMPMGGGQNTGAHLNLSPPAQSGGSGGGMDMAKVAQMAMMFVNRGGAVNPWGSAEGYDEGGDVEEVSPDQFNSIDAAGQPEQPPWQSSVGTPGDVGTMPMPAAYAKPPPPIIPNQVTPQSIPALARQPQAPPPAAAPRAYNQDLKLQDFMMPKSQNPYPDALDRDAGQQIARSPWLALMQAGAKIAQSTGKPGAAIGAGVEAGIGTLTKQRAELRSEQQINQKADELYRHAKSELNKYTRMTPRETEATAEAKRYHDILGNLGERKADIADRRVDVADKRIEANTTLGREKIDAMLKTGNLVYAGPVKGEDGMGYFYDRKHLGEDGQPKIFKAPFDVGAKPGVGGRESARQWAYETYKSLYPKDTQGQADILKGHKTMAASDVRRAADNIARAAMEKQNVQIQDTEEWLAEHKRLSDMVYEKRMKELQALHQ